MRLLILFLLISSSGFAQLMQEANTSVAMRRTVAKNYLLLPKVCGTPTNPDGLNYWNNDGSIVADTCNRRLLMWYNGGWIVFKDTAVFGGGGSNFANANLTATGDRTHDFNGYSLGIDGLGPTAFTVSYGAGYISSLQMDDYAGFSSVNSGAGTNSGIFANSTGLFDLYATDTIRFKGSNGSGVYLKPVTSTAKYKALLLDSTTGSIVTIAPGLLGGGGGVTTVGTFSGTGNANGASISGSTITMHPATATEPGMVSTQPQTWAGEKIFNNNAGFGTATPQLGVTAGVGRLIGVYNSYSSSTNYEALAMRWNSNVAELAAINPSGTAGLATSRRIKLLASAGVSIETFLTGEITLVGSSGVGYGTLGLSGNLRVVTASSNNTSTGILLQTNNTPNRPSGSERRHLSLVGQQNIATTETYNAIMVSPLLITDSAATWNLINLGRNAQADGTGSHTSIFRVNHKSEIFTGGRSTIADSNIVIQFRPNTGLAVGNNTVSPAYYHIDNYSGTVSPKWRWFDTSWVGPLTNADNRAIFMLQGRQFGGLGEGQARFKVPLYPDGGLFVSGVLNLANHTLAGASRGEQLKWSSTGGIGSQAQGFETTSTVDFFDGTSNPYPDNPQWRWYTGVFNPSLSNSSTYMILGASGLILQQSPLVVGGGVAHPSAAITINNTKGLLYNRITVSQRNALSPTDGLTIYCTDCLDNGGVNAGVLQVYQSSSSSWKNAF